VKLGEHFGVDGAAAFGPDLATGTN
jgi:hypothetical protein